MFDYAQCWSGSHSGSIPAFLPRVFLDEKNCSLFLWFFFFSERVYWSGRAISAAAGGEKQVVIHLMCQNACWICLPSPFLSLLRRRIIKLLVSAAAAVLTKQFVMLCGGGGKGMGKGG